MDKWSSFNSSVHHFGPIIAIGMTYLCSFNSFEIQSYIICCAAIPSLGSFAIFLGCIVSTLRYIIEPYSTLQFGTLIKKVEWPIKVNSIRFGIYFYIVCCAVMASLGSCTIFVGGLCLLWDILLSSMANSWYLNLFARLFD